MRTRRDISDRFHGNIKLADGRQEDYIENCLKDAMTIYERISSVPSLAQIIVAQNKRAGHNSLRNIIGQLVALASKTADQVEKEVGHGLIGGLSD